MEDMNMTDVVETQAADTAATETSANGNIGGMLVFTAVTGAVGYLIGKGVEWLVDKGKTAWNNRKKAKAQVVEATVAEATEDTVVD